MFINEIQTRLVFKNLINVRPYLEFNKIKFVKNFRLFLASLLNEKNPLINNKNEGKIDKNNNAKTNI